MFKVKCVECGFEFRIQGITKEQYRELIRQDPDYCDECGTELKVA